MFESQWGGAVVDINAWIKNITPKDAVFIGVNNLVPLSMLIDNPAKKAEVENYIATYLSENEVKLNN